MTGSTNEWSWAVFCGRGVSNFTVWIDGDFGHCFEQLIFSCVSHLILAVTSAYHFGKHGHRQLLGQIPHSLTLYLRFALSVALMLAPVVVVLFTFLYLDLHMSFVDVLSACVKFISWFVHSGFTWRLRRLYHIHIRGPKSVVFSFMITLVSMIIQLRTIILQVQRGSTYLNVIEKYVTFIQTGLHAMYLLTLLPYKRPALDVSQEGHAPYYNISADHLESDHLLSRAHRSYGGVDTTTDSHSLGVGEDGSNCISQTFFWWVQPLMVKGACELLENTTNLFELPKRVRTRKIKNQFQSNLQQKQSNAYSVSDNFDSTSVENSFRENPTINHPSVNEIPSVVFVDSTRENHVTHGQENFHSKQVTLLKALNKSFGCEYYSLGILKLLCDMLGFAGPVLLNLLVSYMENGKETEWHGYLYAGGLFLSTFLGALLSSQFTYHVTMVGLKIRAAIITTVYHKTLSVNSVSLSRFNTGEVVNFMSTDTDRVVNFCPSFHQFWSLPFQVAVSLYLLYQQVGLAFIAGLGFAILLVPINRWIAIKIGNLSNEMMTQKDGRVKVMNEILNGIKVIKFYAWEDLFGKRIDKLREAELKSLKGRKYLDALCVYFWATTPVIISILTFTTYALLGNKLTAAKVFTSLALFNMLIAPLNAFPWVLNGLMEAWVSLKRIQAFMGLTDLDWTSYYSPKRGTASKYDLQIQGGHFSWQNNSPENMEMDGEHGGGKSEDVAEGSNHTPTPGTLRLSALDLAVEKGHLVGIVGKVGCGKSSLLSAILAEMRKEEGHVTVADLSNGFGLAAQESWIQHATLKDNILFGEKLHRKKYEATVEACALTEDLKALPAGDQTEIGENGVTLSGGQRARVALARAVYQNKDVYLLDDPLAAVDTHVAQHLFDKCIMGLLKTKTRILCTHHTSYLRYADVVVVMEHGRILQQGPPEEVLSQVDLETKVEENKSHDHDDQEEAEQLTANQGSEAGGLVQEEERDVGVVKLDVYRSYWRAVGSCLAPTVLVALLLMQASRNVNDWWLSYWVTESHADNSTLHGNNQSMTDYLMVATIPNQNIRVSQMLYGGWNLPSSTHANTSQTGHGHDVQYYLTVYGILAGANSLFTLARAFLFAYGGICAASALHKLLLAAILKAPMSFFDVTPIGRILNRFSSDMYAIDDSLPFIMNILLAQAYGVLGTLVITCYGLPWFAILLLPLGIIYYYIQRYYRHTSREIKRITSITLSPIYAHFSESITGLVTIRALRHSERFKMENEQRLEENQKAQFAGLAASMWLNIRLQMLGVAMVTGVAFIAVIEHHFRTANPGLVGLAISYALSITGLLSGLVVSFTETEKQMVSVERARQYVDGVPQEKQTSILNVPPFWPIQGSVIFQSVHLQYRPGLPNALEGVTFEIQPAEKVGIVGRTGSGKSSLFLALFRMVEIKSGQILVDGINVGHLDLTELRSRMAVIPQDPFLFAGSVRENLDPTGEYSDPELWTALDRCHLKTVTERLGGLGAQVGERGSHFSVGQRQLLCLARALLTRAKILCIDEATASVDRHTDQLIQQTICQEFVHNTVLTIAHRLDTIMDSDRVLVMSLGNAAEFAPPNQLLQNHNSLFYRLVHGRN